MTMCLLDLLAEPAEFLRPYRLPPIVKGDEGVRFFSSMSIKWNNNYGLGYASPFPGDEALNTFYSTTYRRIMNKQRGFDFYLSNPNYRAQTRSQVTWVKNVVPSEGAWLDCGAGFGLQLWTVQQMMPGWSLHAIEPDEEGINELQKFTKVEKDFPGFWRKQLFGPDAFNVISLSHVLEHLLDPITSLKTLFYYLKPGGYLLIEVPNDPLDELQSQIRISDMPHLWFFSAIGLTRLIEETGFQVERVATLGVRRPGSKDSLFLRIRRTAMRQFRGALALLDDPTWYAEDNNRCDLRILARKPSIRETDKTTVLL